MRRPTDAEAHRARAALIEGEYPEGMSARCALCGAVEPVAEGEMRASEQPSTGAVRYFACSNCVKSGRSEAA